mgnify:CR=1 FL=1
MSVYVITNATVLAGVAWTGTAPGEPGTQTVSGTITSSVDLTAMLDEVELSLAADELDFTHMASGGWRIKRPGLKAGTGKLNFHQDFDASQVDARFGLGGTFGFASASTLYLDIKPTGASRSATNPSYVLQFLNLGYQPFGGGVGAKSISPFSFPTTGLVARLTS